MGVKIINVYKEHLPSLRLIGKHYKDSDRVEGNFSAKWGEWFENGWFNDIQELGVLPENGDAYLGVMREMNNSYEYWIGIFFPSTTKVPDGYSFVDIAEGDIATGWIYGNEANGELYGLEPYEMFIDEVISQGWVLQEYPWFFERYNCPRFTIPDEKGNVILDYCIYLK